MEVLYATGMYHGEDCRLNVYEVDLRAERVIVREGISRRVQIESHATHLP
jgi:site-specific recombinase XerD